MFFSFYSFSQSQGWNLIKKNNFVEAKAVFENDLKADSLNKSALKGMIFLSETSSDVISARKYVATYVLNFPEENFYITFKPLYNEATDQFIENDEFSMRAKLTGIKNKAREFYKARKYKEAKEYYSKYIRDFKWNLIGPFNNESGYGHVYPYEPEKNPFDTNSLYFNEDKNYIKWVQSPFIDEDLAIYFKDHLGEGINSPTYYANTFFETQKDDDVEIRLARSWPIKIWVDDELIFQDDEKINSLWDNEVIRFRLEAGVHRVLIKYSDLPSVDDRYQLLNFLDGTGYSDHHFTFRLTDTLGVPLDFSVVKNKDYKKGIGYKKEIIRFPQISYWKSEIDENPNEWFNYYALARFYSRSSLYPQGETYFKEKVDQYPESVFFRYMLSKFYAYNGKIEKTYLMLNGVDQEKTPVYELLYEKFKELSLKNDKDLWVEKLDQLGNVSPSNWDVIKNYIKLYDTNGEDDKRDEYIKKMIKKYPSYKSKLEYQQTRFSQKPRKQITAKEKKKLISESSKRLQKNFSLSDYRTQLRHYKGKANTNKVLSLYDEMIEHQPYEVQHRRDKSNYLFENSKYDEAVEELNNALRIQPYNVTIIERIGDIYLEQKIKDKALDFYNMAYQNATSYYLSSLSKKIEKIEGPKVLKTLFKTKKLDDVLNECKDWRKQYADYDAVVLAYTNDMILDENHTVEHYQQLMVGINNENGIKKWTEFNFSFMGSIYSAKVLKSNGSEVRPNIQGGYVVFKDLQPGDVIQVQGQVKQYNWYTELGRELYQRNYLTFSDPVFYVKTEVALPKGERLNYYVHKLQDVLVKSTKETYDFYKWEYSKLDQVTDEGALIDNIDPYAYIMVSTLDDWSNTVDWYDHTTYKRIGLTEELKDLLSDIVKDAKNDRQKVEAVYNYITSEIKYSYVKFLQSNFVPKRTDLTCSARIGDCKDVATLMISMLRELEIESYYVLVKTENYNSSYMLPSIYFDHVIVGYILDDTMYYSDLTTDYYPYNVLPEMDVDQYGLVIRKGEKNLIKLPKDNLDINKSLNKIKVKATFKNDRSVELNISAEYNGNQGGKLREYFSRFTEEEKYNYVIETIGDGTFNNLELKDYKFQNIDQISSALKGNYSAVVNTYSSQVLDLTILKVPYFTSSQYSSYLSSPNRVNSLDLAIATSISPTLQQVSIVLPNNYKVVDLPKNVSIDNEYGTYNITYIEKNNSIDVERSLVYKKQRLTPQEYSDFRTFYLKMLDEDSRYIALKKK